MSNSSSPYDSIPENFSGLLYPPNAEVGVYLLMGLLWEHLPVQLAMEAFELDPKREGHTHTKYLDAKAKVYVEGQWRDVTMEFKLHSSGLRQDVARHPGLKVDFLVCWIHDAPDIEPFAENILELRSVYNTVSVDKRQRLIRFPDIVPRPAELDASIEQILSRFSAENRLKVRFLVDMWPHVLPGTAEVLFRDGNTTVFRACAYSSEHLIIGTLPPGMSRDSIVAEFGGAEQETTARVPLRNVTEEDLQRLVLALRPKGTLDDT